MTRWQAANELRVAGAVCTFAPARLDSGLVLGAGSGYYTRVSALLDLETGAWTPTPGTMKGSIFDHSLVTLDDGRVLAVGGRTGSNDVATCELFDVATREWTPAPSLSRPRHKAAVVCIAGHVLAIGGCGPDYSVDPRAVEVWHPGASAWTSLSPLPEGMTSPRVTVLADGSLFADDTICVHGVFDPRTQSIAWTLVPDERHRAEAAIAPWRDGIVRMGGLTSSGFSTAHVDAWSAASGWQNIGALPGERARGGAVVLDDGRILVIGGEVCDSSLTGGELDIEYRSSRSVTDDVTSMLIGSPDDGWTSTSGPALLWPRIVRVSARGASEQVFVAFGSIAAYIVRV